MAIEIIMPPLSQTMDSVVLVQWLKAVGDEITKGEPLFVIETDKANLEIEAPASGTLQDILAQPGTEVQVRAVIGTISSPDEAGLPATPPHKAPRATMAPGVEATGPQDLRSLATDQGGLPLLPQRQHRIFASPRARRLALQEDVPLSEVQPTGPQQMIIERDVRAYLAQLSTAPKVTPVARRLAEAAGLDLTQVLPPQAGERITRADVEAALAARVSAAPVAPGWQELSPTRSTIARRMAESQHAAAEVTLTREADATELVHLRQQILSALSERDPRPTYTDFLVAIVARRLRQHIYINAETDGDRVRMSEEVHVAVAVDTDRGLVAPVLRNADRKGLRQLTLERADLVQRSVDGSITPDELQGGTFTITNLGSLGVDVFTPIINPPQIAILGVGRIRPTAAVHEGQLCVRQLMVLSLTFDHRFVDGAPAARFLQGVATLIEKPFLSWL